MAVTRRSARLGGSSQGSGEPASSSPASASKTSGKKRKAATDASPSGGKKSKKAQKTLEETMPEVETEVKDGGKDADVEMKDGGETETVENGDELKTEKNGNDSKVDKTEDASKVEDKLEKESQEGASENPQAEPEKPETKPDVESKEALTENTGESESVPKDDSHGGSAEAGAEKSETEPPKELLKEIQSTETETKKEDASKKDDQTADDVPKNGAPVESTNAKPESNGDFIEEKHARDDKVASNIIEKGIIYFFTRGRVNVEEPEGVQDLQRTFFVLRPIQTGAKLGDGPIDDSKTNRLFALPKKVFPESGKDRFMAFVEKAKVSMKELKEEFFQGSDYETKAGDSRHTPSVDPVGEGVYAITEVGRGSHLSYMLTIPSEPGKLQDDIGIHDKGSFALSLKNPKNKGPANTQLPQSPDFPESIMNDFRGLAWMPVHKSEYLDYPNAQLLLIGEGAGRFGGGAVEAPEGQKGESPEKELERLEGEDEVRVEALNGEDAVFQDLHVRKGEYSVKTTW